MRRGPLLLLPLLLLACRAESRQPSLIEEAAAEAEELGVAPYEKREGLTLDIPYLMGQRFENLPPEVVADQLGEESGRGEGGYPGTTEIRFPGRTLGLFDGEIYHVAADLEYAMDITTAMGVMGFPLHVPRCIDATLECRIVHHWGMRQISLIRSEKGADSYDEIRVWMYRPQEREQGS